MTYAKHNRNIYILLKISRKMIYNMTIFEVGIIWRQFGDSIIIPLEKNVKDSVNMDILLLIWVYPSVFHIGAMKKL